MDELFQKVLLENETLIEKRNKKKSTYTNDEAMIHQKLQDLNEKFDQETLKRKDELELNFKKQKEKLHQDHQKLQDEAKRALDNEFHQNVSSQKETILSRIKKYD